MNNRKRLACSTNGGFLVLTGMGLMLVDRLWDDAVVLNGKAFASIGEDDHIYYFKKPRAIQDGDEVLTPEECMKACNGKVRRFWEKRRKKGD